MARPVCIRKPSVPRHSGRALISRNSRTKRVFKIVGILLACVVVVFWLRVLTSGRRDYVEVPPSGDHRDYTEGRLHTRLHFLLMSDRRGVVFDVFVRHLPPEKAPGPPGSQETQLWLICASAASRVSSSSLSLRERSGIILTPPPYHGLECSFRAFSRTRWLGRCSFSGWRFWGCSRCLSFFDGPEGWMRKFRHTRSNQRAPLGAWRRPKRSIALHRWHAYREIGRGIKRRVLNRLL